MEKLRDIVLDVLRERFDDVAIENIDIQRDRDEDGNDMQGRVNLVFYNELKNGILYAYLPDTAFNRSRLTSTFYPGAMWEICDKDIEK